MPSVTRVKDVLSEVKQIENIWDNLEEKIMLTNGIKLK